jgi:hypothetical protein
MIDHFSNQDNNQLSLDDIYIIKLTNNVTLLTHLEFMDEDGEYYKFIHPYELIRSHVNDEITIGFFPWLYGSKDSNTIVHSMDILAMFEAAPDMIKTYQDLIRSTKQSKKKPLPNLDNLDFPRNNPWKNRMN